MDTKTKLTDLLGGAERGKTRVRGFAPWTPRDDRLALVEKVREVLEEYREHLPMTVRQIFYRLIGAHGFEKTTEFQTQLYETLNRARRAKLIDMSDIYDGGSTSMGGGGGSSGVEAWLASVRDNAERYSVDHQDGQKQRLVIWCEAAGMVDQLWRATREYDIEVFSSGGFDSVTEKHDFAKKLSDDTRPTVVLHVGDHDKSGAHMVIALDEDVKAFIDYYGGNVEFVRVAVTPEQIVKYKLETAPANPKDKRAFKGETCQAEALAPDVLASILRAAVEEYINPRVLRRTLKREAAERAELLRRLRI